MIDLKVTIQGEILAPLQRVPEHMRAAIVEKLTATMRSAYEKAVLQFSAGKYSTTSEVEWGVEQQGSLAIGYIEPMTTKAKVQEFGGKGYYVIEAVSGKTLRFFWDKVGAVVYPKSVLHPPAQGKHYIEQALREAVPALEAQFATIVSEGLR